MVGKMNGKVRPLMASEMDRRKKMARRARVQFALVISLPILALVTGAVLAAARYGFL